MTTIHYTKSALESEKVLHEHYLSNCDDYEHCEQYQMTIDALEHALQYGEGYDQSCGVTYVMDTWNFTFDSEDYYEEKPIKIKDCDIGLNTLRNS